ncbi:MAG: tRNA-dihydrouridine synthase family protein [Spirochaetes bacterium]|nr:tRNA-dihydrouridine synthase family protein [Spirochaetota bacterium]
MGANFQLAPMAELTHRALRQIIHDFGGCSEYFAEMISAAALVADSPFEKWYRDNEPCPERLVFQLVGSDAALLARAAAILDRQECLGIDVNMCCGAPLIRKSGAGAAWMASIDGAGRLAAQLRPAVKSRLSVKLLLGFNEDFEFLAAFCRRLEAEGVEMITLHPRTVMEKFKRLARWKYVGALKKELKIPVAGNGDILSAEQLVSRAREPIDGSVCDAVMVGRAAVRQPWIFARAREIESAAAGMPAAAPVTPNMEETGLRFLELLAAHQPPEFYLSRARRFFGLYCDNLKWGNYLKTKLNRETTLAGIEQVWRQYFKENPD